MEWLALFVASWALASFLSWRYFVKNNEYGVGYRKPTVDRKDKVPEGYSPPECFMRLDKPPGIYEVLKTGLMIFIVPVRAIGILTLLLGFWVWCKVVLVGVDFSKPLPKFRRKLVKSVMYICGRGILFFMGFVYINYIDKRGSEKKGEVDIPILVVSNHVSYLDILLLMMTYKCAFIAKEAVSKVPVVGSLLQATETLLVSQSSRMKKGSNTKDGKPAKKAVSTTEKIGNRQNNPHLWSDLLIFPEGMTTNGASMNPFRSGAFVAGKPLRVSAIKFHGKNFHPAYESIPGAYHVFRTITQVYNSVSITLLPPYYPSKAEKKDIALFGRNVNALIANELNVPQLSYDYADKLSFLKYMRGDGERRVEKVELRENKKAK